jgi:hypothetical protein
METGERTKYVTVVEMLYARGADLWKRSRRNILRKEITSMPKGGEKILEQ